MVSEQRRAGRARAHGARGAADRDPRGRTHARARRAARHPPERSRRARRRRARVIRRPRQLGPADPRDDRTGPPRPGARRARRTADPRGAVRQAQGDRASRSPRATRTDRPRDVRLHPTTGEPMTRPITLFTGQWADMPLLELVEKASSWGFDGLELACWGDHFDVRRAISEPAYVREHRELLERHEVGCWAISNHLVGQAVCDVPIDQRHREILPAHVWGAGEPEGVRRRAAQEMIDTARAAAAIGVTHVNGFTGSSIWYMLAGFPPVSPAIIDRGFADFVERWTPILTPSSGKASSSASRSTRPRSPTTTGRRSVRWTPCATPRSGSTSTRATCTGSRSIRSRSSRTTASKSCTST